MSLGLAANFAAAIAALLPLVASVSTFSPFFVSLPAS